MLVMGTVCSDELLVIEKVTLGESSTLNGPSVSPRKLTVYSVVKDKEK